MKHSHYMNSCETTIRPKTGEKMLSNKVVLLLLSYKIKLLVQGRPFSGVIVVQLWNSYNFVHFSIL